MRRAQSLVVHAVAEGLRAAVGVANYLTQKVIQQSLVARSLWFAVSLKRGGFIHQDDMKVRFLSRGNRTHFRCSTRNKSDKFRVYPNT
jgi:hypothetical protein